MRQLSRTDYMYIFYHKLSFQGKYRFILVNLKIYMVQGTKKERIFVCNMCKLCTYTHSHSTPYHTHIYPYTNLLSHPTHMYIYTTHTPFPHIPT